jgi:hypothetical protein
VRAWIYLIGFSVFQLLITLTSAFDNFNFSFSSEVTSNYLLRGHPVSSCNTFTRHGRKKFLCGRKGIFGLNCQAISDVCGRILDMSIVYGGASSDCLAFEGSDIYHQLEHGLLHDNLVLFGDNAYLNLKFMVTPFPNVSSGRKDYFNFFHSQLRIRVECAFGMLVGRWGILRSAIPQNISLTRTIALVHALAKLHNFCIAKQDEKHSKEPVDIPEMP